MIGYKLFLIIQGFAETIENAAHHTTSHIFALEHAHGGIAVLLLNHLDDQVGMDEGVGETYNLEVPSLGRDLVGILLDRVGQAKRGNRRSEGIVRGTHFVWGEGLGGETNESVLKWKTSFRFFLLFRSYVPMRVRPGRRHESRSCRIRSQSPSAPPRVPPHIRHTSHIHLRHTPCKPSRIRRHCSTAS